MNEEAMARIGPQHHREGKKGLKAYRVLIEVYLDLNSNI
jgi:hypothetical protein